MAFSAFETISSRPCIDFTSPGEELWYTMRNLFTRSEHHGWDKDIFNAISWAEPTGALALFLSNVVISSTQYRLIKAASRFTEEICPEKSLRRQVHIEEAILQELKQYCVGSLGISYERRGTLQTLTSLVYKAFLVTTEEISDRDAVAVCEAEKDPSGTIKCYMCETILHSSLSPERLTLIPLDHIWPRSLGGVSTPENLLPICPQCNGLKGDRISWDVYGIVQDTTHAINGHNARSLLQQSLLQRAAIKLAENNNITLKLAYKKLRGQQPLRLTNAEEPRTYFNLAAHDNDVLQSLWED